MKTKKFISILLAAVLALGVLAGCGSKGGSVSTDGSTSMEKVIGALGESFMAQNKGYTFTYNPTGSGSGIQAVSEGRCDIGLSSRALKDTEKESGLKETILAYDGIAVIVSPENPVSDLTLEQIAAIYTSPLPAPPTSASTGRSSPPRATSSTPCPRTPTPSATPLWPLSRTASRP